MTRLAVALTVNITVRDRALLVGCVRLLSEGYLFITVPEILVAPMYQRRGIGRRLMELAFDLAPTSVLLGAQPGNERFFERLGTPT